MDEALTWFRRAIELQPNSIEFLGYLADAAADWDRQHEAIECYQKIVELDPRPALCLTTISVPSCRKRVGSTRPGRTMTTRCVPSPAFPPPHISLGGLMEAMGDLAEAEARFRKALELHPGHTSPCPGWRPCCEASCPTKTCSFSGGAWQTRPWTTRAARHCSSDWLMYWTNAANTTKPPSACDWPTPWPSPT